MPVFNYAMRRIFTAASTYVIFAIFIVLPIIFTTFIRPREEDGSINIVLIIGTWSSLYSFILSFFTSFFIATILSKTISEEISDGSFLLIISKPLSRAKIITEKLLAVAIVMLISYLIVFFFPLIGYLTLGSEIREFFLRKIKNDLWKLFGIGLLLQFFILGAFSILAMYFNPRLITTAISMFVTFIIIVNILMKILTSESLFDWLAKAYIYIPIILISAVLLPLNWYIFSRKSFG